jgi:hypothetical protein
VPRLRRLVAVVVGVVVVAGTAAAASGRLPLRPLLTFLQFKINPTKARVQHLVQLQNPVTGQVVFLAGTTHQYHYDDPAYSIWHVKSIVTGLQVEKVLVESMPDAVAEGRYGEGPVEMPFITLAAIEAGIAVAGMDAGWDGGWRGRQDKMFQNVQREMVGHKRVLITSGFMHVRQFEEQLTEAGFQVVPWSEHERQAIFARHVDETWPRGLADALRSAITRAHNGQMQTDPSRSADVTWFIEVRRQVLEKMGEKVLPTS